MWISWLKLPFCALLSKVYEIMDFANIKSKWSLNWYRVITRHDIYKMKNKRLLTTMPMPQRLLVVLLVSLCHFKSVYTLEDLDDYSYDDYDPYGINNQHRRSDNPGKGKKQRCSTREFLINININQLNRAPININFYQLNSGRQLSISTQLELL